jgi:alpha-1,2-mannosyltransferase
MTAVSEARPSAARPARGLRDAWTPARARLWLVACAAAAWLPVIGVPVRSWLDFSAFYAAGALAFTPEVARLAPIVAWEAAHGMPITPFVYPAGFALLYVPFTLLPYGVAGALHLCLMLGLLVAATVVGAALLGLPRRWAIVGVLAWGPAAAGVLSGQNTALALLLVTLATVALARDRDLAGGTGVGLLGYKPQLAAPLIGLLLLRGRRLALVGTAAVLAVHYAAGVLATGGNLGWPSDWLATIGAYTTADFQANGWQAISLPALGRHVELATGIPGLMLAGYLVAGVIVLACIPALRRWPLAESVALACACGLLISPHAWVYDATLLLPALGVLAARAAARGWPWEDRWLVAGSFAIALTWPLGGVVGFTLVPLLVVGAPLLLLRTATPAEARPIGAAQAVAASPATLSR